MAASMIQTSTSTVCHVLVTGRRHSDFFGPFESKLEWNLARINVCYSLGRGELHLSMDSQTNVHTT